MKPNIDDVYYCSSKDEHWIIIAHDKDDSVVHSLLVKNKKPCGLTVESKCSFFDNLTKIEPSPFIKNIDVTSLSPSGQEITKGRYTVISKLVENKLIYDRKERYKLIKNGFDGFAKSALLDLLRMYWMGGQTESALASEVEKRGGKGVQKTFTDDSSRILNGLEVYTVTDQDKGNIESTFKKGYKTKSVRKSYLDFLDKYFPRGIKSFPSQKQYYQWGMKLNNIIPRKKKTKEEATQEVLQGSAQSSSFGICSEFLVDNTIDNVYVQSEDIRGAVVGRLTLYFIVDVYSGQICGFYLTNEHPSYVVACKALINAGSDKVEFCKQFNIDININQWPCKHIPIRLIADRGELVSNAASKISQNLKIKLSNLPPYSPELKGYVETQFKTFQNRIKDYIYDYGLVQPKENPRMIEAPATKARLTITTFQKLLIRQILHYNKTHRMWDHPDIQLLLSKNIDPSPNNIWLWANSVGKGNPRVRDKKMLWTNLLTTEPHRCSSTGIEISDNKFKPVDSAYDYILAELEIKKEKAEVASVPYSKYHKYLVYKGEFIPLYTRRGVASSSDLEFTFTMNHINDLKSSKKREVFEDERELNTVCNEIVAEGLLEKPSNPTNIKENRKEEIDKKRAEELNEFDPDFGKTQEHNLGSGEQLNSEENETNTLSSVNETRLEKLIKLNLHG
jgi:transposase InsO family protein